MVRMGNLGSVTAKKAGVYSQYKYKNGRWWGWEEFLALEAKKATLSKKKLWGV